MHLPTLKIERSFWKKGPIRVAGVDEAGRGALAGPVVAGAVVFNFRQRPNEMRKLLNLGIRDSKALNERQRELIYEYIICMASSWSVGVVSHTVIDKENILNATMRAMHKAIAGLMLPPDQLLIDGKIALAHRSSFKIPYTAYIHGDSYILSIAAASIVAKVTRDRLMRKLHVKYPLYGFDRHKGYGTRAHYRNIALHGASPIHRKSFFLG